MSQKISSYKELKFWQIAKEVSLSMVKLARNLPNERIAWIISDQVLRSSFSIGANIAEGFGKYKGKEYKRFIQMALGSSRETEYWLELLKEIYPKFSAEINTILGLNEQVIRMLIATVNSLTHH
ncbi:MAG: four helix bundle protein [Microgenomates group bacterium]